jgi:hypothetical protein
MQVHDELVFEVPSAELDWLKAEIPRIMASVAQLKVPLVAEVGVGANWDQAHWTQAIARRWRHRREQSDTFQAQQPKRNRVTLKASCFLGVAMRPEPRSLTRIQLATKTAVVITSICLLIACAGVGTSVGISVPIGRAGGVGVSIGSGGTVSGTVGAGAGGGSVSVGASGQLPKSAEKKAEPEAEKKEEKKPWAFQLCFSARPFETTRSPAT